MRSKHKLTQGVSRPLLTMAVAMVGVIAVVVFYAARQRHRVNSADSAKVSFNDTIQPILSENCYACHGLDSAARKANLRLDRADFAYAPHGQMGPAIIPGKPDKSPLIRRIESKDPKQRMPPEESHRTLEPGQIAALREWVKEGAHYEPHWSFVAAKLPMIPATKNQQWPRNDIDRVHPEPA